MAGQTYICTPGSSFIPAGTENDLCTCRHERWEHWWGGGDCGGYYKTTGGPCRCEWFKPSKVVRNRG